MKTIKEIKENPKLEIIQTGEAVDFVKQKPKSTIGAADMEGLVCKPAVDMLDRMGRRVIVKVKVRDFE